MPLFNIIASLDIRTDPVFSKAILVAASILVAVMIYYLYSAQRQIASKKIVGWLTAIRISLIVLLAILMLRPRVAWEGIRMTPETLWVVLDQSLSMAQKDKQATPIERLRWADALGLMPADTRTVKLDRVEARLRPIYLDLVHLQQQCTGVGDKDTARLVTEHDEALKAWNTALKDYATELDQDKKTPTPETAALSHDLSAASEQFSTALAGATPLPWDKIGTTLSADLDKIHEAADKADNDFIARHGSDAAVKAALDKVAAMRRADIAYEVITRKGGDLPKSLIELLEHQNTKIVTFASDHAIIAPPSQTEIAKTIKVAGEPVGSLTDLNGALSFVAGQIRNNPEERASVLVISDGRSNDGGDPTEAAKDLGSLGARVFTLGLGTKEVARDAAVESPVDAPDWIYADDTLNVSARIRLDNLAGQTVNVEFRRGDQVLGKQTLFPTGAQQNGQGITHEVSMVRFSDKPPAPGVYNYSIRIPELPDEVTVANNVQSFRLTVKEEKLNVILVQDQPRWEDRYIAAYLKRDRSVKIQQVLHEPALLPGITAPTKIKAAPTEKADEAQLLPETAEEWAAFDLIVIGDVSPDFLTAAQQENIAKAVRMSGTSLLVMAGNANMPKSFGGQPIADLLPVKMETKWTDAELAFHRKHGFRLEIAPEGTNHVLTKLNVNEETSNRYRAALDAGEPVGYWHSQQTLAKQSAHVLWRIKELDERPVENAVEALALARDKALLSFMEAGYGRVVYLSGDSLWRMRYVDVPEVAATGTSPALPEVSVDLNAQFWGQLVRWTVQSDMPAGGKFIRFGTSKPRYVYGDSVVVNVRLLTKQFTPMTGQKFKVVARNIVEKKNSAGQVEGDKIVASADAVENSLTPGRYQATLSGIKAGAIEITLEGEEVTKMLNEITTATTGPASRPASIIQKTLMVDVLSGNDREMQNVNADPAALARICQASGGMSADIAYADIIAQQIPNVDLPVKTSKTIGLFADPKNPLTKWAHWGFLAAFVILITTEWIVRKVGGLV